jgi:hypothetical protein
MAEFLMVLGLIMMFFSGFTVVKTLDSIGGLGMTIMIIVFAVGFGLSYWGYNFEDDTEGNLSYQISLNK